MNEPVDIDKIIWREVDDEEYYRAEFTVPHRATTSNLAVVRYELGSLPVALPTKRGAIVKPSKEWAAAEKALGVLDNRGFTHDTIFIRVNSDGPDYDRWVASNLDEADSVNEYDVQEALDNGGTIVFEGIEE